jgi:prepilin-type N-terminal cleavage/methylation domain-containing protein
LKIFNYKHAFTLAEVLITLGIIGVVAALTLPSFFANYQEKELIPKIKESYSLLSQGVITSEVTNSSPANWNYELNAEDFYNQYLNNYFIINKKITVNDVKNKGIKYIQMDGNIATDAVVNDNNSIVLEMADGFLLFISEEKNAKFKTIAIDINNYKSPNIIGKDLFLFAIQNPYGLTPYGFANGGKTVFSSKYEGTTMLEANPDGCRNSGAFCFAYIMFNDWNMGSKYPR